MSATGTKRPRVDDTDDHKEEQSPDLYFTLTSFGGKGNRMHSVAVEPLLKKTNTILEAKNARMKLQNEKRNEARKAAGREPREYKPINEVTLTELQGFAEFWEEAGHECNFEYGDEGEEEQIVAVLEEAFCELVKEGSSFLIHEHPPSFVFNIVHTHE